MFLAVLKEIQALNWTLYFGNLKLALPIVPKPAKVMPTQSTIFITSLR